MILIALSLGMAFVCGLGWLVTRGRPILAKVGLVTSTQVPGLGPAPSPKTHLQVSKEQAADWNKRMAGEHYLVELRKVGNGHQPLPEGLKPVQKAAEAAGISVEQFEEDLKKALKERG